VVDLHELDGRAVDFDERDRHSTARPVRLDDHSVAFECGSEVVDLERDVRDGLDEIRVGRVVPVTLLLDPNVVELHRRRR
jgi:hypothetical protein